MSPLWTRLRERKLFQWAAGYSAAAIAGVELLGMVADSFGWPPWVNRAVLIATAFGFLLVVVLAWYHGERGSQRVTRGEMVALGGVALAGVVAVALLAPGAPAPEAPVAASLFPSSPGATRVGVIPFDDLGPAGSDDGYVAAALREEITTQVSKVATLAVVRSDSRFRDVSTFPLAAMADSLRVRYLLGGSVLRDGNRVRVTVWIHDAEEGREVWRESKTRLGDGKVMNRPSRSAPVTGS